MPDRPLLCSRGKTLEGSLLELGQSRAATASSLCLPRLVDEQLGLREVEVELQILS